MSFKVPSSSEGLLSLVPVSVSTSVTPYLFLCFFTSMTSLSTVLLSHPAPALARVSVTNFLCYSQPWITVPVWDLPVCAALSPCLVYIDGLQERSCVLQVLLQFLNVHFPILQLLHHVAQPVGGGYAEPGQGQPRCCYLVVVTQHPLMGCMLQTQPQSSTDHYSF